MLAGPPRAVGVLTLLVLTALITFYLFYTPFPSPKPVPKPIAPPATNTYTLPVFTSGTPKPPGTPYTRILVIPRLKTQDVSWITTELPDLPTAIYTVDDPSAPLTVPKNKGHEAMVYLTYLIDHYDALPDTILFFHAHRTAWHNNFLLGLDAAETIRRLKDDRVARLGYMNTRCHHDPGCLDWLHLDRPVVDFDMIKKPEEKAFTRKVWAELHPGVPAPPALSQPCCAQFAVSGERVRQIPKARFEHYRDWLLRTELEDQDSGRVMEYLWQYIFTGNAEYCPAIHSCYCDGYGLCFGSHARFMEYMGMVEERDRAQEELGKLEKEEGEGGEERKTQLRDKIAQLNVKLVEGEHAATVRGQDPKNREAEAERAD
ncbi:hypothetical protein H2201_002085 [Coniosporium apollinis]|uniref:Uncharacterized protein n=2 Tax=Coniosporium TaxID=2810619 RepID=A0ABQ9NZX8_9PEZI|nr:hypothetical protein H2199_000916 [Cladosporium sp. JES 115]KAJ9667899.1 hypothetical protein H2201_002085 [Coniosporium apollinis]